MSKLFKSLFIQEASFLIKKGLFLFLKNLPLYILINAVREKYNTAYSMFNVTKFSTDIIVIK